AHSPAVARVCGPGARPGGPGMREGDVMNPKDRQEFHRLMSAILDGALEPGSQDRLGELLRQHGEARDLYLAYFSLHADPALVGELRAVPAARPGAGPAPLPARPAAEQSPHPKGMRFIRLGVSRRARFVMGAAFGLAGLAAGLLLILAPGWKRAKDVSPPAYQ